MSARDIVAATIARVPDALVAYRDGVAAGPGGPGALPLASLRDPAVFDGVLAAFAAGCGMQGSWVSRDTWDSRRPGPACGDRCALVSYWSQYYLAVLATPALTALVRLGRPLPLAFEETRLELDAAGRPCRLLVGQADGQRNGQGDGQADQDRDRDRGPNPGLAGLIEGLVEGHLRPFVEVCRARCGLAPRVVWGNAAVILDHVAGELDADESCGQGGPTRAGLAACLGWRGGPACATSLIAAPLGRALCMGEAGCRRRVCCLRRRLPGVPSCGALCPIEDDA